MVGAGAGGVMVYAEVATGLLFMPLAIATASTVSLLETEMGPA
jgi:hypothetical protein